MSEVSEKGQDILEFLRVKDGSDKDGSDKIISKMVETLQNEIQVNGQLLTCADFESSTESNLTF